METKKRILDSVHGYIEVPFLYIRNIIDSVYFQRLRRIEQTSTRSLFPCARHDRFIHSLGVYHLGTKIVKSMRHRGFMQQGAPLYDMEKCMNSYLLACLLHDVAHSPFSHTFEDYYAQNEVSLDNELLNLVNDKDFNDDYRSYSGRSAPHEKMSAYLAFKVFKDKFVGVDPDYGDLTEYADWILIVRMICGIYYNDVNEFGVHNCMIDLIHGDVIDADGLDYVCRDAWAAGYQTSNVDVDRLIDAIEICKDKDGIYRLAFTSKALNEIEAVLSVKNFQQYHVINHHTISYEQNLLKEAVKVAARHYFEDDDKIKAIARLCSLKSFTDPHISDKDNKFVIHYPMDDDFVAMMKSCMTEEPLVNEWFSRDYRLKPVWKSRAEFYHIFEFFRGKNLTKKNWIFSHRCHDFLVEKLNLNPDEVWILRASPKYKGSFADKVYISIKGNPIKYIDLFPGDKNSFKPSDCEFFYIYIKKECNLDKVRNLLKQEAALYVN